MKKCVNCGTNLRPDDKVVHWDEQNLRGPAHMFMNNCLKNLREEVDKLNSRINALESLYRRYILDQQTGGNMIDE
jgi:hypothetical protein